MGKAAKTVGLHVITSSTTIIAHDAALGYHHRGYTDSDDSKRKQKDNNFGLMVSFTVLF